MRKIGLSLLFLALVLLVINVLPALAQSSHSVDLSWTASTDAGASYNLYRITGSCPGSATTGAGSKLTATPLAAGTTSFVDSSVSVGSFCYYATAVLNGAESVPSNLAPAVILPASPSALTVVSIK